MKILDAREMPAPEPFVQTLSLLENLKKGELLRLILPRKPFPLYAHLAKRGIAFSTQFASEGEFAGCFLIDITAPPKI